MRHYQLTSTEAICPICHSKKAHLLWSVNSDEAAQHYVLKEADPQRFQELTAHIKKLWQQDTCDIVRCGHCEFCYSYPYIAGDDRFYTLAYDRSGYPTWKWEHQLTYDALKKSRTNFTLLEVGAGDGAFVKGIAPELTDKENVLCTEFSDYGRQQITEYGIKCLSEDVRRIQSESFQESLDVVCMFQVIEHLDDLEVLFERLNNVTHKNSSLFISVPNPKLVEFAELNGGLLDMPPNHIGRWNLQCFEEIGERWGWKVENYEIENSTFSAKASLFYKYRFWRKSQETGSLANRVLRIKNSQIRSVMKLVAVSFYALTALPELTALRSGDLGFSQWVHLMRNA
jgi:2-polyprenyl-3-methyl-5-hydroxy-6-metoxy-1,4-benzoquinol methylase